MGIAANAKALMEQHGFDYDVAYLSAWYGSGRTDVPTASPWQVIAWMSQVKHVPVIDEETALRWLGIYSGRKGNRQVE